MADERDGTESSISPWLRDDWESEARAETRSPRRPRPDTTAAARARGPAVRLVAGAATAVVALATVVWIGADAGPDSSDGPAADAGEARADPLTDSLAPAPATDTPASTTGNAPTTAAERLVVDPETSEVRTPGSTPAEDGPATSPARPPGVALLRLGEPPAWTESDLEVPPELASLAPTELIVTTSDSILHLVHLPSGRVRSVDLRSVGQSMSTAVGPERIVLYGHGDPVVLDRDAAAVRVDAPDDAVLVQHRRGTGDFIVTSPPPTDTSAEQRFVLQDDRIETAPPSVVARSFWDLSFLPDGSLVANEPGGVYRIADDGTAARISTGVLVATGDHHYALEECDAALTCELVVVAAATDERRTVPVDALDGVTPSSSNALSPDGRSMLYIATESGRAVRRIVDLDTRATVTVGAVDQLVWNQVWASDSTGVFTKDRGTLSFVRRVDGRVIDLDLDGVLSVAARPAT